MYNEPPFDTSSIESFWTAFWNATPGVFLSSSTLMVLIAVTAATAILALIVADLANQPLDADQPVDGGSACPWVCDWQPARHATAA